MKSRDALIRGILPALLLLAAARTHSPSLEGVKCLPALPAFPELPDRRRGIALRTHISMPARQLGQAQQRPRMLQSAPAVHQHKEGENSEPCGMNPYCKPNERYHSEKTEDSGN